MNTWHPDDDELFEDLLAAVNPERDVPRAVLHDAEAVFTWRTVELELAQLAYDSAAAAPFDAAVRGESATLRRLTFEAPGVVIELEVTGDALIGLIAPPEPGSLRVETEHEQAPPFLRDVDDDGYFAVCPIPAAAFRLVYRSHGGRQISTPWIRQ